MLDMRTDTQRIDTVKLFDGLPHDVLDQVRTHVQFRRFDRHDFLFHMCESAAHLYFLQRGIVGLSRLLPTGKEHLLDIVQPGDTFGELFLGHDKHRIGTAQALSDVGVWTMPEAPFAELVQRCPTLCRNFIRHLTDQRRRTLARLDVLLHAEAGHRLLFILLELAERTSDCATGRYDVPEGITQDVLARLANLNRSTTSTLINEYRREGILGGQGRTLVFYCAPARTVLADADLGSLI